MFKFINFSIKFLIIFTIICLFFAFSTLWYFSIGLPDYKKLSNYQPPISSRVYSGDGKLIAEYAIEKRLFIPFESIPKKVINSFLSAEDKNFFNHPGVDAKGIVRALLKNLKNITANKRLEGASTITQQVAKNFLLTNEVSLNRKIKEAILAFRIERAYSKERILELYLNQIYLGQGTYGIAAASLEYFDKSVKDLNYTEAALLAALPKAPSRYDPFRYPDVAKFRRNLVLQNLENNNYISKDEFKEFKNSKIILKRRKIEILNEANSYTEEVRRSIKEKYGFKTLYSEGLSIRTPLDIDYQIQGINSLRNGIEAYDKRHGWRGAITNKLKDSNWRKKLDDLKIDPTLNWKKAEILELNEKGIKFKTLKGFTNNISLQKIKWAIPNKKTINDRFAVGDLIFVKKENNAWNLKQYPKVNGGIVAIDAYTGDVKALVGGFNFKSSEFNRVTQAKRQPGSAFKPIVYAAALENGYSPNSIVLDAPFVESQGVGLKDWKPENYGKKFYGPSPLRKGIENSRNLMTIRIAQYLGMDKISEIANRSGIVEDMPRILSMALGAGETTLLDITKAYASFVNGGTKIDPIFIDRIQDRRGITIYKADLGSCNNCLEPLSISNTQPIIIDKEEKIITATHAYQVTSMLKGAVDRGTGKKTRFSGIEIAGKTGTTNNNTDAWFIGYSSDLIVGVYTGFDKPLSLGKKETGSSIAVPIFKEIMSDYLSKNNSLPFRVPKGIELVKIDLDTGKIITNDGDNTIYEAFGKNDKIKASNETLVGSEGFIPIQVNEISEDINLVY